MINKLKYLIYSIRQYFIMRKKLKAMKKADPFIYH